jgi:bile acid:Na+ symporter, BASS family
LLKALDSTKFMDQLINVLVIITLIGMMASIGLGVNHAELLGVARNWRLVAQAAVANYIFVPAITIALLALFQPADPMVSVGFLILAVCPGAPFGPPCVKIAGGNVPAAVGTMVILAGSSAIAAPLFLYFMLPWLSAEGALRVDAGKIVKTLLVTQLMPLSVGLGVRHWLPQVAKKLEKSASIVSAVLGLCSIGLIVVVQFNLLAAIGWHGWVGMALLLIATVPSGWLLGGPGVANRKSMALTTSLRNVGVGLVIATGSFGGTVAVTAATAYGIFEIFGSFLLALVWGRRGAAMINSSEKAK